MNIFKKIKLIGAISKKVNQIERIIKGNKDLIKEVHETIEDLTKKLPQFKELLADIKELIK